MVLHHWKTIGYELGVGEEVMMNLDDWKYTGKMKMVDILKAIFEIAKNDGEEDYVKRIKNALKETGCQSALGMFSIHM